MTLLEASLISQMVKKSACNVGDLGSIPGSGRFPGECNGNQLQYSCLENSIDRGTWQATVHVVRKSQTWQRLHFHFFMTVLGFPGGSGGK